MADRRRLIALAVAAPWLAWAIVRIPGLDVRHPLVALMAFTPYAALTSPLPVVVALLLRRPAVALLAAVVALALVAVVLPRGLGGPDHGDGDGKPLVAMTFNLRYGLADPRAVVDVVRRRHVDVLALEELTPEAVDRLDAAGLDDLLPGRLLDARAGAAGSGLFARGRLRGAGPGIATYDGLRVQVIHPPPPIRTDRTRIWQAGLRAVPPAPGLVLGDFNGTLDNREVRKVLDRGYVDAADAAGEGLRWTYPAGRRALLRITIDHVLVPHDVAVRRVSILDLPGSDHRAVVADLRLPEARE